jgi:flagellar FliL protein
MAEQKKENPNEGPKKSLNVMLLLQIVFAVVNVGIVGGGAYLVYASTMGWHPPVITEKGLRAPASVGKAVAPAEAPEAALPEVGPELTPFLQKLDKFTVNLNGEPRRTIRLEVNLEMLNEESYEEVMDVSRMPKIRDRIVAVLNDKTFSDLESIQGKLFLKEKITSEVNAILDKGVVKDIYFSEFVVQ